MLVWLLDMDKGYLIGVHGMDKGSFLEGFIGEVLVKIFLEVLWLGMGNGVTSGFGLAGHLGSLFNVAKVLLIEIEREKGDSWILQLSPDEPKISCCT